MLAKTYLLIIGDFRLEKLPTVESRDLLELIADRIYSACTVVAGQLPVEQWHSVIGEPAIADTIDAIVDRLINGFYKNYLKGDSMRKSYVE